MALRPPPTRARPRRWLASAALMLALTAAYWVALEHVGTRTGDEPPAIQRAAPHLDRHTPRVE